jgi:hypothetical protein
MIPTIEELVAGIIEKVYSYQDAVKLINQHIDSAVQYQELRDLFASQALSGLMTSQSSDGEWRHDIDNAASISYLAADALLRARNVRD